MKGFDSAISAGLRQRGAVNVAIISEGRYLAQNGAAGGAGDEGHCDGGLIVGFSKMVGFSSP